jgi:hypothetical protein
MGVISHDWQQDLKQLLARESMLNAENGKEILLYAPAHKNMIKIEGWQVSRIDATHKQTNLASHLAMLKAPI